MGVGLLYLLAALLLLLLLYREWYKKYNRPDEVFFHFASEKDGGEHEASRVMLHQAPTFRRAVEGTEEPRRG